jgi:hypothetical protein
LVPTEDKWGVGDVMIGVLFRYVTEGDFKALMFLLLDHWKADLAKYTVRLD